jgi:glycosyltransferase involved in cell wall biosynthesis
MPYPVAGGDRLRVYHVLRGLCQAGSVELLCLSEGEPDPSAVEQLRSEIGDVTIMSFPRWRHRANALMAVGTPGRPLQAGYYRFAQARRWIDASLRRADLAFAFHVRMTDYLWSASIPTMVDLVDAISMNYRRALKHPIPLAWRAIYRLEIPRLEAYEVDVTRRFGRSYVVSEADRSYLVDRGADPERLSVLGNGTIAPVPQPSVGSSEDLDLVFVGHMGTQANQAAVIYFVKEVLPILHRRGIRPHLTVVGLKPGEAIRALAGPEITVTGEVADPLVFVRRSKVVLAPMVFGAGVQNKILEGMSMGKPVVTTSIGAEGLRVESGEHLLIADGPEPFADAVAKCLADEGLRRSLGVRAVACVRQWYSWEPIYGRIAEDVMQLIRRPDRATSL